MGRAGIAPEPPRVSVVGNVLLHGPNTEPDLIMIGTNSSGAAYLEDNLAWDRQGARAAVAAPVLQQLSKRVGWPQGLVAQPAAEVMGYVLSHSGARPKERDAVDARIIASVRERRGSLIDSQAKVGGYPADAPTRRPLTVPEDVGAWLSRLAIELE